MDNRIVIDEVSVLKSRIQYKYTVMGEWQSCFNLDEEFYIEYSIDISSVPTSVAVVPLLANLLPMAWVCNAEIVAPVCDKAFYNSIDDFKRGYEEMYPEMKFSGKLAINNIEDNYSREYSGALTLFSGGVDAFDTLLRHVNEHPTLVTLWGADVKFEDIEGWEKVLKHLDLTSDTFDVNHITVKSCFRRFLKESMLNMRVIKDNWWHGYQHGIGLLAHTAPIAYVLNKEVVYIASSFTAADKGKVTCASDPTIDNFVKFANTHVMHDGYECVRQVKIHNIIEYSKYTGKKVPLRVCWESEGGANCCKCEKCWRTILGIYAEGVDPLNFGFEYESFADLAELIHKNEFLLRHNRYSRYAPMLEELRKNYTIDDVHPNLRWLYVVDINKLGNENIIKKCLRVGCRLVCSIMK